MVLQSFRIKDKNSLARWLILEQSMEPDTIYVVIESWLDHEKEIQRLRLSHASWTEICDKVPLYPTTFWEGRSRVLESYRILEDGEPARWLVLGQAPTSDTLCVSIEADQGHIQRIELSKDDWQDLVLRIPRYNGQFWKGEIPPQPGDSECSN